MIWKNINLRIWVSFYLNCLCVHMCADGCMCTCVYSSKVQYISICGACKIKEWLPLIEGQR